MNSEMMLLNTKVGTMSKTKAAYTFILPYIFGSGVEGKNGHFMEAKLSQPSWGHTFFLRDRLKPLWPELAFVSPLSILPWIYGLFQFIF